MGRTEFKDFLDKKFGRTEGQILRDFLKLGYKLIKNDDSYLELNNDNRIILINKFERCYQNYWGKNEMPSVINMQEHNLLTELFKCWGWL